MNKRKSRLAAVLHPLFVLLGITALSGAIVAWPDVFFFSKVVRLPEFARELRWLPGGWILLCVLGAALTAPGALRAGLSVAAVLLAAPAAALLVLPAPVHHPLANSLFDLAWFAGFHGAVPAAIALVLAGVRARLTRGTGE